MLIPSKVLCGGHLLPSLSRRVNANSQLVQCNAEIVGKLIKKGEC